MYFQICFALLRMSPVDVLHKRLECPFAVAQFDFVASHARQVLAQRFFITC